MTNDKEPIALQRLIAKKKAEDTKWKVNALQLINIFCSMNYTLGESVADLIDNSIDIKASEVDVYYEFDREKDKRYLIVVDNGSGMDEKTLDQSMDIGAIKERNRMDLGKFGIGLKLSSLAQAKEITVITKTKNKDAVCRRISYEYIKRTNDLRLLKTINPESHYEHAEELLNNFDTGTVVLWEEMWQIFSL
jgi:light-regulated signal transduction histidine kinase (bacteriophytochrome)